MGIYAYAIIAYIYIWYYSICIHVYIYINYSPIERVFRVFVALFQIAKFGQGGFKENSLVVEPTPLNNMSQNGFIFPKVRGENSQTIWNRHHLVMNWSLPKNHGIIGEVVNNHKPMGFFANTDWLPRVSIIFERTVFAPAAIGSPLNGGGLGFAIVIQMRKEQVPPGTPSVLFLGNLGPLKPATIALKIGHLAFQSTINCPKWWFFMNLSWWIPWDTSPKKIVRSHLFYKQKLFI